MSLYQLFFEIELNICELFPCLSPFDVRKQKATEVFLLLRRINTSSKTNKGKKKSRIRRPAGDNWF